MTAAKNIKRDILWRVYLVYALVLLFGVAIVLKLAYIQFREGEALLKKAQQQELKFFNLEASRGNIYADDGSLLATSIPVFELRMDVDSENISDKLFYSKVDSLAYHFSRLFPHLSKSAYKQKLKKARKKGNRYLLIARNVNYEQLQIVKTFPILRLGKFKGGLIAIPRTQRQMPFGELARRTIGYENKKENLFVGLEGAYADVIEGVSGKQLKRKVNNGDWIPINDENGVQPIDGKDLITTIDVNIQDVAQNALYEHLKEHKAFQGCAILMEVATGHIKAIANLRLDTIDSTYKESYNYAIAESVEPGSTFKLVSFMAALEFNKVKLTDSLETGNGWKRYYGQTMKDDHKIGDGKITARTAFEKSSNVGTSIIIENAFKENPAEFVDFIYGIKLNKKLGIEIQGERPPVIKHPSNKKYWYGTSLPWMSIGYELQLTPIQTLAIYNAVANNGKYIKPMFVKGIRHGGKLIKTFETEVLNEKICSQFTIDTLKSLMEGVVERGTASLTLKNTIYKIAGKTGTAQIAKGKQGYDKKNYNASFAGYFPADNPKYSCIVVVNNPKSGRIYGSSVAAPVFKEIADKVYASELNIHAESEYLADDLNRYVRGKGNTKDLKLLYETFNSHTEIEQYADWATFKADSTNVQLSALQFDQDIVPNVKGMGARDATYLLEKAGLKVESIGRGLVSSQSLRPGLKVKPGETIILNLKTNI